MTTAPTSMDKDSTPFPLLEMNGITFAAIDVLSVGPLIKQRVNPPTFRYVFGVALRDGGGKVLIGYEGKEFDENSRFPEWERDACLKANNARNAVIQAVWRDSHVTVVE
jgi:hypothetical protein